MTTFLHYAAPPFPPALGGGRGRLCLSFFLLSHPVAAWEMQQPSPPGPRIPQATVEPRGGRKLGAHGRPRFPHYRKGQALAEKWAAGAKERKERPHHRATSWCSKQTLGASDRSTSWAARASVKILAGLGFATACALLTTTILALAFSNSYSQMWFHSSVKVTLVALLETVYPVSHAWRVTHSALDILTTSFCMSNALCESCRFNRSKTTRMIVGCLPEPEGSVIRRFAESSPFRRFACLSRIAARQFSGPVSVQERSVQC